MSRNTLVASLVGAVALLASSFSANAAPVGKADVGAAKPAMVQKVHMTRHHHHHGYRRHHHRHYGYGHQYHSGHRHHHHHGHAR